MNSEEAWASVRGTVISIDGCQECGLSVEQMAEVDRHREALMEIGRLLEGVQVALDIGNESTFRLVAAIQCAARALNPTWR